MILMGFEAGQMGTNCYIVGCEVTQEVAIIDPGGDASQIKKILDERGLTLSCVVNTHGHMDHIGGNQGLLEGTEADLIIHKDDAAMLTSSGQNLSLLSGIKVNSPPASRTVQEGDTITIGNTVELQVIHTPGHTPGGISLALSVEDKTLLFVGDTLFNGSIGRSDFPGGSHSQLIQSIKEKLLVYPDETEVYPGHGPATTVGYERSHNPFLV